MRDDLEPVRVKFVNDLLDQLLKLQNVIDQLRQENDDLRKRKEELEILLRYV